MLKTILLAVVGFFMALWVLHLVAGVVVGLLALLVPALAMVAVVVLFYKFVL